MKKILLLILMLFVFPSIAFAKSDYYTFEEDLILEENKNNSYFAFGNDVSVKNRVDGIYMIFGDDVNYNANNQYVSIFSNNLNLSGTIRDGFIVGNNINFSNANILRDIVIVGNNIKLSGKFAGSVLVYGTSIDVTESEFLSNLIIDGDKINIDSKTSIVGKLEYPEGSKVDIKTDNIGNISLKETSSYEESFGSKLKGYVYDLIGLLVIFLVMYLIIPSIFDKFENNISKNLLYGLISFICLPLILLILLFTTFAFKAALIGTFIYIIFIMISKVVVGYVIGDILWDKLIKSKKEKYLCGLIGIALVYILSIIPILGVFVTLASLIYGFGIILNMIIKKRK